MTCVVTLPLASYRQTAMCATLVNQISRRNSQNAKPSNYRESATSFESHVNEYRIRVVVRCTIHIAQNRTNGNYVVFAGLYASLEASKAKVELRMPSPAETSFTSCIFKSKKCLDWGTTAFRDGNRQQSSTAMVVHSSSDVGSGPVKIETRRR